MVHIPDLGLAVSSRGEEEVAGLREEAERGDGLGVRLPCVDEFLGDVVLDAAYGFLEIDIQILRDVHVRSAQVVVLL